MFPHSFLMTMDEAGVLMLRSPDKVTIGLLYWNGPGPGVRLLLQDTDRFSSHVNGTFGMLAMALAPGVLRNHLCLRTGSDPPVCAPLFLCLYPSLTRPLSLRPVLPGCALGTVSSS